MHRARCETCRKSVWYAQHESTWRTVQLDHEPSVKGDYVVVRDAIGRIVVRSVYGSSAATDGHSLFVEHRCEDPISDGID